MDNNSFSAFSMSQATDTAKTASYVRSPEQRLKSIDEKSKEFESVFVKQMLEHMFSGIDTGGMFGGGESEEIYRSFMLDEYSKLITQTGGIGIADHVKREMIAMQEKGNT